MKHRLPLLIVLFIFILIFTAPSTPSPAEDSGWTTTNSPDWIGTGEDWALWSDTPLDAWQEYLATIQKWHFNTLRLSFRFPDAPAITHTPLNHEQLDAILNILKQHNIQAVLDMHNWQDHHGYFGSDSWFSNWQNLATTFKGDTRIIAFELYNEPLGCQDVTTTLDECADLIHRIDPSRQLVYPSPQFLTEPHNPEHITAEKVIIGFHVYCESNSPEEARNQAIRDMNYIGTWAQHHPVWISETCPTGGASDAYTIHLINTCLMKQVGFCLWLYSRDTTWYDSVLDESHYP